MRERLIEAMARAATELRGWPTQTVRLFHHNDTDGISSGAILETAFERAGFRVDRCSLEKPYPQVLERVFEPAGRILVFADFAGRIAPLLSDLNRGRNLVLILDHHVAAPATDPMVHNLDPDLYGLKGDRDISASTTCYLFARALDAANRDLAHIAAIGAVGDAFFVDGRLVGDNREAALEARRRGRLEIEETAAGERYLLAAEGGATAVDALADRIEILGGVGYYRGGPDIGVRACRDGWSDAAEQAAAEFGAIKTTAFARETERLRSEGFHETPHIQWLHVGARFSPMGVKMVGVFCHGLREAEFIDPDRYIAGYQAIADEIPGFGSIGFDQVKISMRAPPRLERMIRDGRAPGLDSFLPEATHRLGGFADACHTVTAAATVAIGKEEALIAEMEAVLGARAAGARAG